jgi:ABC-type sulfate transport system permease component
VLADLRDVSIILLALESIVIGVILLLLLWQLRLLVLLLRDEIGPILQNTQETTQTVQSTTKFVGKRVAKPFVGTISFMAGVRGALRAVTGDINSVSSSLEDTSRAKVVRVDKVEKAPAAAPGPQPPASSVSSPSEATTNKTPTNE